MWLINSIMLFYIHIIVELRNVPEGQNMRPKQTKQTDKQTKKIIAFLWWKKYSVQIDSNKHENPHINVMKWWGT